MSCMAKRRYPTISCCGPDEPQPKPPKQQRSRSMGPNPCSYKYMTSRVLSAAAGGQYYGRDDQYTLSQAPRLGNPVPERILLNTVHCCGGECPPDLHLYPPLCKSSPRASVYVPDIATKWYAEEYKKRMALKKQQELQGPQLAPIGKHCYPTHGKKLKVPIRLVKQKPLDEKNFKRISPEFLSLLKQHDEWLRERFPVYEIPPSYLRVMKKKRLTDEDVAQQQAEERKKEKRAKKADLCGCGMTKEYYEFGLKTGANMCYPACSGRPPYGKRPATTKPDAGGDRDRSNGDDTLVCKYATNV